MSTAFRVCDYKIPADLGAAGAPWVGVLIVCYLLIAVAAPLLVMLYVSLIPFFQTPTLSSLAELALDNYARLLSLPGLWDATLNTIIVAVVSATLVMVITALAAWFAVRSRIRGTRLLDMLGVVPLVIPGLVLGLGLSFVYLRSPYRSTARS